MGSGDVAMTCRERLVVLSSVASSSLLINLIFTNEAQAQLTISGSNQMSINQSQTLTASGCSGGYSRAVASGGEYGGRTEPTPV